jgi:hypothetical protein
LVFCLSLLSPNQVDIALKKNGSAACETLLHEK